jgi:hypothetical protein
MDVLEDFPLLEYYGVESAESQPAFEIMSPPSSGWRKGKQIIQHEAGIK